MSSKIRACARCGGIAFPSAALRPKGPPPPFKGRGAIDPGIAHVVRTLWENGIETFESCDGSPGHAFPEPTVRFHGGATEGYRAFAIAQYFGLRPFALRRYWTAMDGELVGPHWEMTFVLPPAEERQP